MDGDGGNWMGVYPGELSLIVGRAGVGKSLLVLDLVRRILGGECWPPGSGVREEGRGGGCAAVLWGAGRHLSYFASCFGMDPWGVIWPEEGERSMVALKGARWFGDQYGVGDAPLVKWLKEVRREVRVLVLDPLPAFLGPVGAAATTLMKQIEPVLKIAGERGFPVIGVMPVGKGVRRGEAQEWALGSVGYTALARSVVLVVENEGEVAGMPGEARLVLPVKNNFAAIRAGYGFVFKERRLEEPARPEESPPVEGEVSEGEYRRRAEKWDRYERICRAVRAARMAEVPAPPELVWNGEAVMEHPMLRNGHSVVRRVRRVGAMRREKLVWQRVRMMVMMILAREGEVRFGELMGRVGGTEGNVGAHLRVLEEANVVKVRKEYEERRPVTFYELTAEGKRLVGRHVEGITKMTKFEGRAEG